MDLIKAKIAQTNTTSYYIKRKDVGTTILEDINLAIKENSLKGNNSAKLYYLPTKVKMHYVYNVIVPELVKLGYTVNISYMFGWICRIMITWKKESL